LLDEFHKDFLKRSLGEKLKILPKHIL